jgi:hypothetical protein
MQCYACAAHFGHIVFDHDTCRNLHTVHYLLSFLLSAHMLVVATLCTICRKFIKTAQAESGANLEKMLEAILYHPDHLVAVFEALKELSPNNDSSKDEVSRRKHSSFWAHLYFTKMMIVLSRQARDYRIEKTQTEGAAVFCFLFLRRNARRWPSQRRASQQRSTSST